MPRIMEERYDAYCLYLSYRAFKDDIPLDVAEYAYISSVAGIAPEFLDLLWEDGCYPEGGYIIDPTEEDDDA
jgi:hypothetical protein